MREKPLKDEWKNRTKGCLNCGAVALKLLMNTKITQSFGGESITRNGRLYYRPDSLKDFDKNRKNQKTLMTFENKARKDRADWRMERNMSLHSEIYQRQGKNNWVMIKKGMGFA